MSTDITTYTELNKYAILAKASITAAVSPDVTTITKGFYGKDPLVAGSVTGNYSGNRNDTDATTAHTELGTLRNNINGLTLSPYTTFTGATNVSVNLTATGPTNVYYSGSSIIFTTVPSITLNGGPTDVFYFIAGSTIDFNTVSNIILNGILPCNVYWLANSSISTNAATTANIPGIFIAEESVSFAAAVQVNGGVYARNASITFLGSSSVSGLCSTGPVVCYAKGTLILTQRGLVPIEKLKAGQSIVTKGKINFNKYHSKNANIQVEPLLWVSKFKVVNLNSKSRPICIKKDALGENKPFKDLYVSPGHALLLDGHMVRANSMINGTTIYQDNECEEVEYYHVELDSHSAVFANGILAESYLAVNNRHVFENSISLRRKPTHNLKNIRAL